MSKRSFLLALAAGLLVCSQSATDAMAVTVLASEDEGTFNFTLTADGKGNIAIDYTGVMLTTINNVLIPTGPIAMQLHGTGGEDVIVTSTVSTPPLTTYTLTDTVPGQKSFGIGPGAIDTATIEYRITSGQSITPSFLNLSGSVQSVIAPLLETTATSPTIYDFSPFAAGGAMSLTYTKVGANFAGVIADGGVVTGTGGFTELAVPEPTSMVLLTVGLSWCLALRRYLKRSAAA